jgi:hypothetical protein
MGNLFGGILGLLMGVPGLGLLTSGLSGLKDKFQGLRGYNEDGTPKTQEQWEEDRQTRINEKRIGNILNRTAPITEMTQKNLAKLGYTGNMPGVGSTPTSRAIDKDYARGTNTFDGPFSTSHLNTVKNKLPGTTQTFSDPFYGVGPVPNVPQLSMMEEYYNNNTPIGFVENLQNKFGMDVRPAGNYSQNAVAHQLFGGNVNTAFDDLNSFQQGQVMDAIGAYGTTSLGTLGVKDGGRIGYANGGLASLFTRRG